MSIPSSFSRLLAEHGIPMMDTFHTADVGLAYASWHSEPKPGGDAVVYAARSIRETCEYIQSYPVVRNKTAIFALVVAEVH